MVDGILRPRFNRPLFAASLNTLIERPELLEFGPSLLHYSVEIAWVACLPLLPARPQSKMQRVIVSNHTAVPPARPVPELRTKPLAAGLRTGWSLETRHDNA